MPSSIIEKVWRQPLHFVAFGFGSGLSPIMPGTCGTIMAIPFYLLLQHFSLTYYLIVLILLTLISIWICGASSRDIGVHDYPGIVLDEFVGYWWTMVAAPKGWLWILLGFILFRIFDIWKPWPIRVADKKIKGGFGIVFDDILAAIPAFFIIQVIASYFINFRWI